MIFESRADGKTITAYSDLTAPAVNTLRMAVTEVLRIEILMSDGTKQTLEVMAQGRTAMVEHMESGDALLMRPHWNVAMVGGQTIRTPA